MSKQANNLLTIDQLAAKHRVSRTTIFSLLKGRPDRDSQAVRFTKRAVLYPANILDGYAPIEYRQRAGKVEKKNKKETA